MIQTPLLTTDGIIECFDADGQPLGIVLIQRANEPIGLALPGGFVDIGERVEDACIREMKEETHLDVTLTALLGVYSDPKRDSRFHTVSVVYICQASGVPIAGDDAKSCHLFPADNLPLDRLVFDHKQILLDYLAFKGL